MTRTVADAALMMAEMSRPDPRDGMSLPPADLDWDIRPRALQGLRIGLLREAGVGLAVDPEVAAVVEAAAHLFAQAGAIVEPLAPYLTREMIAGLDTFWRQRAWADIAPLPEHRRGSVLPYILEWAEGGRGLGGDEVYRGLSQMHAMRDAALRATAPFDFVLSPVAPNVAYAAELASPTHDPAKPFEHICFTVPLNFSEQPACSINAGYTETGLPIGLQIAGRRFDDTGVLAVAAAFEEMRGPQREWPRY